MISAWTSRKRSMNFCVVEREAVAVGLLRERVEDPLLPVDQGSVAVGGDPLDVFELRKRPCGRGIMASDTAAAASARRSDGPTRIPGQAAVRQARRARPDGRHAATSTPRSPPRTRSATPAWSRRRSRSASAARPAGSRSPRTRRRRGQHAEAILGMDIRGFTVHDLWIEQASEIAAEYYASIILDRWEKKLMAMLSRMGGMDVEEIAETDPDALVRRHLEPGAGAHRRARREIAVDAGIDEDVTDQVAELLVKLYDVAIGRGRDADRGQPADRHRRPPVVALDSKTTIDGNALFRHPELAELTDKSAEDPQEAMAKEKGLTYVKLGGNIGILGNGAGLCMSTLDVVAQAGRQARQLPRRRRRLEGRRDRRRARGDHLRRATSARSCSTSSAASPAATRSPRGSSRPRAGWTSRCRWSSASTAPTPRRGSASSPRPSSGNLHVEKTMLGAAEARRRAGRGTALSR